MLNDILAAWRHVGIELEWMEVQFDLHFVAQTGQRLLERTKPDRAPGARDIGHEIDFDGFVHAVDFTGIRPRGAIQKSLAGALPLVGSLPEEATP